ncbi:glycoside hydrolase family 36 protein [Paenibacillus rigui]|uniref:Alpha-galactosidase n=1 Tax=Paenibacillus rigui TaxID=554312 RepID=A0A229UJL2_9BACL|nr:alpha-galactosidase [Paenibacillus rigui]OXM83583.1 alpha-galactosidase [Paenibacillus rigui]
MKPTFTKTDWIGSAFSAVRGTDGTELAGLRVIPRWRGNTASFRLHNEGALPVSVQDIVLLQGTWPFDGDTPFYGEGYSMLSQYNGTMAEPLLIGAYDDHKHYKLPETDGFCAVYNFALLSPQSDRHVLIGFTSCRRFTGEVRLADRRFELVLDGEGLTLAPGESWELEELAVLEGSDREALLQQFAEFIQSNHPLLASPRGVPSGWCSWYCFGPAVTEQHIFDNLGAIGTQVPQLRYIQIDDGYQAHMGDWLTPGASFSDMERLCKEIKAAGFEPAIWVAPFIAQRESELFQTHPDWFIQDEEGQPLASNRISFGGWRHGPWYMLDGTHPEARAYLRMVFRTMREGWGCHYFKLDANMWGALPGGRRHLRSATKVEAYRMGMEAVLEGAGADSFLLGCNAPMWPSLGTVHGMRVTGDISRKWPIFKKLAAEGFSRNWQHQRLWVNDPDCLVLENRDIKLVDPDGTVRRGPSSITPDEFGFHAAYIIASGGMVLSGDDVCELSAAGLAVLRKALTTRNIAARFDDSSFRIGRVQEPDRELLCLFNWSDEPSTLEVALPKPVRLEDFWTGESLGFYSGTLTVADMAPHSGRVLLALT